MQAVASILRRDRASDASFAGPGLKALGMARKGDTRMIWKLDRLGRSMKG